MAYDIHSPLAYALIAAVISQSSNTLILNVSSGNGVRFSINQQVTIWPQNVIPLVTNAMICRITGITGDQITLDYSSGNREGTNVITIVPGMQIANTITPKVLTDIEGNKVEMVTVAPIGIPATYHTTGTNDQIIINTAITAVSNAGGGTVFFKAGIYFLTALIIPLSNVNFIGEGSGNTIFKVVNGVSSSLMDIINPTNISNVLFAHFQIDGNKANQTAGGKGLRFDGNCSNITIDDIYVHDTYLHNIIFSSPVSGNHTNIKMSNIRCENAGTSANGSGIYLGNVIGFELVNLISSGHTLDGIQWKVSDNITLTNIICHDTGRYGLYAFNGHADITNLNVYNTSDIGIHIEDGSNSPPTTVNITNAVSHNSQTEGMRLHNVNNSKFINVKVYDNGQAGGTHAGIKIQADTSLTCNNNSFVNCASYDDQGSPTQTFGIWTTGAGTIDKNYFGFIQLYGNTSTQFRKDTYGTYNVDAFNGSGITFPGDTTKSIIIDRSETGAGQTLTIQGGSAQSGATNAPSGGLILSTGISTGNVRSAIQFSIAKQGNASGSTDNIPTVVATMFMIQNNNPIMSLGNVTNSATGLTITSNTYALAGNAAGAFQQYRNTTTNTAGSNLNIISAGSTVGATDQAAGNLILSTGISTGMGGGSILLKTPTPQGSTNTTDNTPIIRMTISSSGIDVSSLPITSVLDPVNAQDAATKHYVDSQIGGGAVTSLTGTANQVLVNGTSGTPSTGAITLTTPQSIGTGSSPTFASLTLTSPLSVANGGTGAATLTGVLKGNGTSAITGGATTTDLPEGTNLYYTDARVRLNRLDQMASPTASVSMNSQKITNLLDPTAAQDAATKNYVDSVAQGLSVKPSAIVATTTGLPAYTYLSGVITMTSTGTVTIDGHTLAFNDIVLVKDETSTNAPNNGLYTVTTAGAIGVACVLTRNTSMNTGSEFPGAFVFIESGTVNASSGWVCTNSTPPTLGTTNISFQQFSGAGEITAGTGLSKSGNTISLSTPVTIANGGTGQTTASAAFNALSPMTTLGDIIYGGASGVGTRLGGNTTTTRNFLRQTGNGSASAAPAWDTVTSSDVGLGNVENTALSTWAGSTNITTLGTIGSGTWQGTTIAVANGGTGQTSYTDGQLLIGNTTGNTLTKATLTAGNSITITNGHGSITVDTIQDIRTTASPTFAGLSLGTGSLNTVGNVEVDGSAARDYTVARAASGAGQTLTIQGGGAATGASNSGAGGIVLSTGISTGNARSAIQFKVAQQGGSGTGDNSLNVVATIFMITTSNPILALGNSTNSATGLTTTSNALAFSGQAVAAIEMYRQTTSNTAGNNLIVQAGGATSGATDKNGGNLLLDPGISTGLGRSYVSVQGLTPATATGTGDNSTYLDRCIFGAFKALTNNSATNLVNCTLASNTLVGGIIRYAVEVFDGTNLQMETGEVTFQCANKGGSFSGNTITQIGSAKQFLGSGTLSMTWAISAANPAVISLNANSSLTPSTGYPRITYSIENFTQQAIAIQ